MSLKHYLLFIIFFNWIMSCAMIQRWEKNPIKGLELDVIKKIYALHDIHDELHDINFFVSYHPNMAPAPSMIEQNSRVFLDKGIMIATALMPNHSSAIILSPCLHTLLKNSSFATTPIIDEFAFYTYDFLIFHLLSIFYQAKNFKAYPLTPKSNKESFFDASKFAIKRMSNDGLKLFKNNVKATNPFDEVDLLSLIKEETNIRKSTNNNSILITQHE